MQVRDAAEATYRGNTHIAGGSYSQQSQLPGASRDLLNITNTPGSTQPVVAIENVNFVTENNLPNRNVYCTTQSASRETMEKFEYDACIIINDAEAFRKALGTGLRRLQLSTGRVYMRACTYQGRDADYHTDNGYWLKDSFYTLQQETRFVVEPYSPHVTIKTEYLNLREIIPFVSLYPL